MLDARPGPVEGLWEEDGSGPGVGFVGNDRDDAAAAGRGAIALAVVALVGDGGPGSGVRPEIQQRLEQGLSPASPPVRTKVRGRPAQSVLRCKATRVGLYKCYQCRKQFRVTVGMKGSAYQLESCYLLT